MKNLLLILLLLLCLAPLSFAGAIKTGPNSEEWTPGIDDTLKTAPAPAPREVIVREVREIEKAKPSPAKGLSIGAEGFYPVLAYTTDTWTISGGYTSRSGDQSILLSGRGDINQKEYTKLHAGMSVYPGSTLSCGVFVGVQQFITDKASIGIDLFPIRFGSIPAVIGDVSVVGRLYL